MKIEGSVNLLTEDFGDLVKLIDVAVAREQRGAVHHLRVKAAYCPHVHRLPVPWISNQQFRRAIPSSCHVIRAGLVSPADETGEAKIAELYHPVR